VGLNNMNIFVDGEYLGSVGPMAIGEITLSPTIRVVALSSGPVASNITGGFLLSASNGVVSDSSWRCSSTSVDEEWTKVRDCYLFMMPL
jgi:hypothetical protein